MKINTKEISIGTLQTMAEANFLDCESLSFEKGARTYILNFFTHFQFQFGLNLGEVNLDDVLVEASKEFIETHKHGIDDESDFWNGCDSAQQVCVDLVSLAYSDDILAA